MGLLSGGTGEVLESGGHCEHLKSREAHREEGALHTHSWVGVAAWVLVLTYRLEQYSSPLLFSVLI